MIYQVKIDKAVLFTGEANEVIKFLSDYTRYPLKWLHVYGFDYGPQNLVPPYREKASDFVQ